MSRKLKYLCHINCYRGLEITVKHGVVPGRQAGVLKHLCSPSLSSIHICPYTACFLQWMSTALHPLNVRNWIISCWSIWTNSVPHWSCHRSAPDSILARRKNTYLPVHLSVLITLALMSSCTTLRTVWHSMDVFHLILPCNTHWCLKVVSNNTV